MHARDASRKTSSSQTDTRAIAALVVANAALAFGPWFVRMADVGPVATGFWRIALAGPEAICMALASEPARACVIIRSQGIRARVRPPDAG